MSNHRVGRRQLEDIRTGLADREMEIIATVGAHRFLTTQQICRFHFTDHLSKTAALRSANRTLSKLRDLRVLVALERRIGGVRAGSGAYVWSLGVIGARLLQKASALEGIRSRYREREPSVTFLRHTLAVAEVSLRLREAARRDRISILGIEHEPDCWRAYSAPGGGIARLKPDLAVISATDNFEDHWFFEVDLATEPPSRIVRTCLNYQGYYRSGVEQQRLGLFPAVVWIVPSTRRKETIERHMKKSETISARLFRVITLDEMELLLSEGAACPDPALTGAEIDRDP